jgi:RNA polymerase sigma factor (sigma-70 family)
MVPATTNHILTRTEEHQLLQRLAAGEINAFWQIFQQHRDYLLRCCLKWMNGNSTEAEDLLSQAMVKAWEKAQKYAGKIENFKCWLTTLTRNFWIDLTRRRGANQVEDIEVYADRNELGLVSVDETPASALDCDEKKRVIRAAIDELPTRLRETFILHFYEELSHQEISERQNISYQNVCKRISQARAILREELRGYFIGEEGTKTELAVTSAVTEPTIEEMPEGNAEVEAIAGESVTLSVAIAEVEAVGGEESPFVALSEQQCELDSFAAVSEGKLEVKSDSCWCVEATLYERQPAPILVNAQFDEETGHWGSSCLVVQRMQQQPLVGKGWGEFLLYFAQAQKALSITVNSIPSCSSPLYCQIPGLVQLFVIVTRIFAVKQYF